METAPLPSGSCGGWERTACWMEAGAGGPHGHPQYKRGCPGCRARNISPLGQCRPGALLRCRAPLWGQVLI